ncbi:hypothetical protein MTO96_005205 [Rhipicephalus appendiculatus]
MLSRSWPAPSRKWKRVHTEHCWVDRDIHDSAGHGRFISYVVDSDGRVHVKHDPSVKAIMTHMEQSALPHDFHWFRPLLNPAFGLSSLHLLPRLHQPFMCLLNPCSTDPYYNRHSDQYMRMMHGIA